MSDDAVLAALEARFFAEPQQAAELGEARASAEIADLVYALRVEAGLTQRELARRAGTSPAVICRIEKDQYRGAGLAMLRRVAAAVGKRVQVRVVALLDQSGRRDPPATPAR